MIKKKLRIKILLGALALVLVVCTASTSVVSVIVSKQNRDSVVKSMENAMTVIKDSIVENNAELSASIEQMAAMNKFGEDTKFIEDFGSSGLSMVGQSFEKIRKDINNTAAAQNLYSMMVYGADGNLLCYVLRANPHRIQLGFFFDKIFHTKILEPGADQLQAKEIESSDINGSMLSSGFKELPQQSTVGYARTGNFMSVKTITPIYSSKFNRKTKKNEQKQSGFIVSVKLLGEDFIGRMDRMTGMQMNLFVNDAYSVGDFKDYKKAILPQISKNSKPGWQIKTQDIFFNDIELKKDTFFQASLPVYSSGEYLGSISLLQSDRMVKAKIHQMILMLIIVALCCLGIVIPIAYFAAGKVVKPVIEIKDKLKDIAEGEGDLTTRLEVKSADEIGQVAEWFNTFIDKIHSLISDVAVNANELKSSSKHLSQIAGVMASGAEQTSLRANTVSAAGEEMSVSMDSVASAMDQATNNMGMVSAATEEMSNTINEISKNTVEAKNITDEVVSQTRDASSQIEELGEAADEIENVVQTITDISDQVNLLALNATIEAARAGDAGKGFAVVANEIKELANQTAAATADIKGKVEKIRSSTGVTVAKVGSISEVVEKVSKIVIIIAAAVEEQSATTQNMSENILQITKAIDSINENISQSSQVSSEIAQDIGEVSTTAEEMTASSSQVNAGSENLAKLSDALADLVAKFKI